MARPKKKIDEEQVRQLALIQCSYDEMAAVLRCNPSTLTNRFSQVIKEGRASGRMSLKRKQYTVAMQGNVGMLIWLGKQYLDQTDKSKLEQRIEQPEKEKKLMNLWNELEKLINDKKLWIEKEPSPDTTQCYSEANANPSKD